MQWCCLSYIITFGTFLQVAKESLVMTEWQVDQLTDNHALEGGRNSSFWLLRVIYAEDFAAHALRF